MQPHLCNKIIYASRKTLVFACGLSAFFRYLRLHSVYASTLPCVIHLRTDAIMRGLILVVYVLLFILSTFFLGQTTQEEHYRQQSGKFNSNKNGGSPSSIFNRQSELHQLGSSLTIFPASQRFFLSMSAYLSAVLQFS